MLYCISTIRQAKSEIEIKALDDFVLEEMSLDHRKTGDRFIPNYKLYPKNIGNFKMAIHIVKLNNFIYYFKYVAPIVLRRKKAGEKL